MTVVKATAKNQQTRVEAQNDQHDDEDIGNYRAAAAAAAEEATASPHRLFISQ